MTHDERVRHHMYDTNEGIAEQSERIASLEELVLEMWGFYAHPSCKACPARSECEESDDCLFWDYAERRMEELGVGE